MSQTMNSRDYKNCDLDEQCNRLREILTKTYFGEDFICEAKPESLKQHYGGAVVEFEATATKSNSKFALVSKTLKPTKIHLGLICNMRNGFMKDKFFMLCQDLYYQDLSREFKLLKPPTRSIQVFPKLLKNDEKNFFFMFDLKKEGYYNWKLDQGMDHYHTLPVIGTIAIFHAYNKLAMFSKNLSNGHVPLKIVSWQLERSEIYGFEDLWKHFCSLIFRDQEQEIDSRIRPYKQCVENLSKVRHHFWSYSRNLNDKGQPWLTIVHGNLCGNNMMFIPKDGRCRVRLLDLEFSRIGSVAEELMFFIGYNVDYDLARNALLIRHYLTTYLQLYHSVLRGCFTDAQRNFYGYDCLMHEFRREGIRALFHCLSEILVFYGQVDQILPDKNIPDSACVTRAKEVIDLFIHLGWINQL